MIKSLNRIVDVIIRISMVIASIAMATMFLLVITEIVVRKFFNTSTYFSSEYTEYGLAVVILFGLADLFKRKQHLSVKVFSERLGPKTLKKIDFFFSVIVFFIYSAVLTGLCFRLAYQSFTLGIVSVATTHTPQWAPQALMVIGLFTLAAVQLVAILNHFFGNEKG